MQKRFVGVCFLSALAIAMILFACGKNRVRPSTQNALSEAVQAAKSAPTHVTRVAAHATRHVRAHRPAQQAVVATEREAPTSLPFRTHVFELNGPAGPGVAAMLISGRPDYLADIYAYPKQAFVGVSLSKSDGVVVLVAGREVLSKKD